MADVSISIDGDRWKHWESVTLQAAIDNFKTATFTGPFDPTRSEYRRAYRPFQFQDVAVEVDGNPFITGTMLTPQPKGSPDATTVQVDAYGKAAAIMDSYAPSDRFPLEFNGLNIYQIAQQLCGPLDIELAPGGDVGPAFKRVKLEANKKIGDFLADLAKQRGLVMRDTPGGQLLFTRSSQTGRPIASLVEGEAPLMEAAVTFSPQNYFSEITGMAKHKPGRRGAKHRVENPHLSGVVRPYNFAAEDIDKGDLPGAVNAKLARMFGNMAGYVVKVPTWYDESGRLWEPDRTLSLHAPSAMVYSPYEFLIRDVLLTQNVNSETASLGLVMPGAFSGETPATLPWSE